MQIGSNLFYMRARDYTPATGQFLSNDPIGLAGGDLNIRRYVFNSPTAFIDPAGEQGTVSVSPSGQVSGTTGGTNSASFSDASVPQRLARIASDIQWHKRRSCHDPSVRLCGEKMASDAATSVEIFATEPAQSSFATGSRARFSILTKRATQHSRATQSSSFVGAAHL